MSLGWEWPIATRTPKLRYPRRSREAVACRLVLQFLLDGSVLEGIKGVTENVTPLLMLESQKASQHVRLKDFGDAGILHEVDAGTSARE